MFTMSEVTGGKKVKEVGIETLTYHLLVSDTLKNREQPKKTP